MDSPGVVAPRRWSSGKRAGVVALVVASAIGAAGIADALFYLRPVVAEKFWIGGLHFGTASLREEATFRLRNYPTRGAADELLSHIRNRVRAGDRRQAARAIETLCILSGRSFGIARTQGRPPSCGSPDESELPSVLEQIDQWAQRHLGAPR